MDHPERPRLVDSLKRLSARLRRAAARAIAPSGDYAIIQSLARRAGIRDVSVLGELGLIQGSLDDMSVLAAYARTKTWRPAVASFFTEFFAGHEQASFIDVGANIGLSTIPIAANPAVRCFAFEPDPDNLRYLRNNVHENCPHGNVRLFDLALFDRAGHLGFRRSNRFMGDHHLSLDGRAAAPGENELPVIEVPMARLDDVLQPHRDGVATPLAAKIVAQGAETHIVAGGRSVLSQADALLIEIYPYGIERLRGDLRSLLRFCSSQFSRAVLNAGEHDALLTWVPVDDAALLLEQRYQVAAGNAAEYYHLFLKR